MKETKNAGNIPPVLKEKLKIDEEKLNAFLKSRDGMMVLALTTMFILNMCISLMNMH